MLQRGKEAMEQKTKAAILHDIIRKFASGGKDITPRRLESFRGGPERRLPDRSGNRHEGS